MSWFRSRQRFVALAGVFAYWPRARVWRFTCLVVTSLALFTGTARSTPIAPSKATTDIPIQIINTNAGRVMTAHASQYEDKVYIGGLVYRPPAPGIGAHVHVWGVDKHNQRVFFKTTSVQITGRPSLIHSESFVVSVDPAVFEKASVIFVTFHSQSDAESRGKN